MAKLEWDDALALGNKEDAPIDLDTLLDEIPDMQEKEPEREVESAEKSEVTIDELDSILSESENESNVDELMNELDEYISDEKEQDKPIELVAIEEEPEAATTVVEDIAIDEPEETSSVVEEVEIDELVKDEPSKADNEPEIVAEIEVEEDVENSDIAIAEENPTEERAAPSDEQEPTRVGPKIDDASNEQVEDDIPFCPNCGEQLNGNICNQCGWRSGASSLLEKLSGKIEYVPLNKLNLNKEPVQCNEVIVRKNGDTFEVIGMEKIPVKIVELSDEDVNIYKADHILKTENLSFKEKSAVLKFEDANADRIQAIFGKSVAELNGLDEAELAKHLRKEMPKATQALIEKILSEVGLDEVPGQAWDELAGLKNPTESEICKIIIRAMR